MDASTSLRKRLGELRCRLPPQSDRKACEVRDHCAIIHTHAIIYDIMYAVRTQ